MMCTTDIYVYETAANCFATSADVYFTVQINKQSIYCRSTDKLDKRKGKRQKMGTAIPATGEYIYALIFVGDWCYLVEIKCSKQGFNDHIVYFLVL